MPRNYRAKPPDKGATRTQLGTIAGISGCLTASPMPWETSLVQLSALAVRPGFLVRQSWLMPFAAFLFAGDFGDSHEMQGLSALLVVGAGYVSGFLWQVFFRRDLADRLAYFVAFLAMGCLVLLVPSGHLFANSGPVHALAGILAGLVVAEQVARWSSTRVGHGSLTERHPDTIYD